MSKNGLVVDGEGWFIVNAREARWKDEGPLGSYCTFEGKRRFPHFGINISVLEPGERIGMYHRENGQETFLVLAGECTLIVEGEERQLTEWDFFYRAPRHRAHHRRERETIGSCARGRCARAWRRRRRRRLQGLQGRSALRS
jgi:quercetin dioxygenase-like cupin family protein